MRSELALADIRDEIAAFIQRARIVA